MATRIAKQQVCDRCEKAFADVEGSAETKEAVSGRKTYKLYRGDHVVLTYEDLCERCDRVVDELVKRIMLETPPKAKPAVITEQAA